MFYYFTLKIDNQIVWLLINKFLPFFNLQGLFDQKLCSFCLIGKFSFLYFPPFIKIIHIYLSFVTEHQTRTCPTNLTCGRSRGPSAWTRCLTTRAPRPWRTRLAAVRPRVTRCSSGWSPCSTRPDRYHCTLTCSKSDGVVTHSPLKEVATLMYTGKKKFVLTKIEVRFMLLFLFAWLPAQMAQTFLTIQVF